jgi:hypothetical protein
VFEVFRPHGNYLQAAASESHTETKKDLSILTHKLNQPASFDVQTNVLEFSYTRGLAGSSKIQTFACCTR